MTITLFSLEDKDKSEAIEKLITGSSPRQEFFMMVVLSILVATFGLLIENVAVIIGSMLIAPLILPILSLALGIVIADNALIARSGYVILKSVVIGVIASVVVTLFFLNGSIPEIITSNAAPSIIFGAISFIAGVAATFSYVRPNMSAILPGVAIAVALIPPTASVGIGIAIWSWPLISGSILLLFVNIVGIIFGSMIVFSLSQFQGKKKEVTEAIKEDNKEIEKEKNNSTK